MSDIIFEHTDSDDDRLKVEKAFGTDGGEVVYFRAPAPGVFLTPDAVTRLREALEPYDPATKDAKQAPAPAIWVGSEYRLLPGAKFSGGTTSAVADEVTRVRVNSGPDRDGDYDVEGLDGERPGRGYYVLPQYLAPLDEPKPAIEAGREYRVLPGARASVTEGVSSIALDEVTRVLVRYGPDGDGDYYVTALDGNDPGDRYFVLAKYLAPLDEPKPEAVEIGREYRLLPGACFLSGYEECRSMAVRDGVTRVQVDSRNEYNGDYWVRALDGANAGAKYRVMAKYLAPLDEPAEVEGAAPTLTIVDETHVFRAGDLTDEQAHALADGAYLVTPESFPLDARRVAALKLAAELAGPASIFGGTSASTVLVFAAFLLDELADEDTEDDE